MFRKSILIQPSILLITFFIARIIAPVNDNNHATPLTLYSKAGMFKLSNAKGNLTLRSKDASILIESTLNNILFKGSWKLVKSFHGKKVYTGHGDISMNGDIGYIQWMGKNLQCHFHGTADLSLYAGFSQGILGRQKNDSISSWYILKNKNRIQWPEYSHTFMKINTYN